MTTEGKIIFDVLNEWVYNAQDQAGEKLIIVDASDFDKIIPEIEEKLKEVKPLAYLFEDKLYTPEQINGMTFSEKSKPTPLYGEQPTLSNR